MISRVISWAKSSSKQPKGSGDLAPVWRVSEIADLLRHFPIGSRVLYYPEFKKELRLESVLLGCSINQKLVYSQHQIGLLPGEHPALELRLEDEVAQVSQVTSFHFVVPHQARSEIDYRPGRQSETEGRLVQTDVNDFEKGSIVTLISHNPYGRVPNIETAVKGVYRLAQGFYANHRAAFLEPFTKTVFYTDKRVHRRVQTRIPALVRPPDGQESHPCILEDFSERFVKLRVGDNTPAYAALTPGGRWILALDLGTGGPVPQLQGIVFRKSRGSVVLELRSVLREGRFASFQLIDQLELKASLLNHPETQRMLARHR